MNFLLKIVEGPNKGAEIALVEGVAVTLGKSDACDIVLADPTMPDQVLTIEATADSVALDGGNLDPFVVKTFGATSFAVGPADSPWSELVWPKEVRAEQESEPAKEESAEAKPEKAPEPAEAAPKAEEPAKEEKSEKKRGSFVGCLVVLLVLLVLMVIFGLIFRAKIKETDWHDVFNSARHRFFPVSSKVVDTIEENVVPKITLAFIANKYGLELSEDGGRSLLSGNLKTRSERLAATAEAYQVQPGVEIDISDDQSFRNAAEDALFTLTEGLLKVSAATNRALSITGVAKSPLSLKKTLEALDVDLPKMRSVDVSGVVFSASALTPSEEAEAAEGDSLSVFKSAGPAKAATASPSQTVDLPVCGILTAPYPCLVLKNGSRVLEGAPFGGSIVEKIEADSVTLTNSTGRFTWKP